MENADKVYSTSKSPIGSEPFLPHLAGYLLSVAVAELWARVADLCGNKAVGAGRAAVVNHGLVHSTTSGNS